MSIVKSLELLSLTDSSCSCLSAMSMIRGNNFADRFRRSRSSAFSEASLSPATEVRQAPRHRGSISIQSPPFYNSHIRLNSRRRDSFRSAENALLDLCNSLMLSTPEVASRYTFPKPSHIASSHDKQPGSARTTLSISMK